MNRVELAKWVYLYQAEKDGKTIQITNGGDDWTVIRNPNWNATLDAYRVAPVPIIRYLCITEDGEESCYTNVADIRKDYVTLIKLEGEM